MMLLRTTWYWTLLSVLFVMAACDGGTAVDSTSGKKKSEREKSAPDVPSDEAFNDSGDGEETQAKGYDDSDIIFESDDTSIAILPEDTMPEVVTDISTGTAEPPSPQTPAPPGPPPPPPPPPPQTPDTNQKVIDFANGRIGTQVGNGLCSDLELVTLNSVSAAIGSSFASASPTGTQFFLIADDEPLFPGDFMHWQGNTNHNNYPAKAGDPLMPKFPGYLMFKAVPEGHVSVIKEVISPVEVKILHQNINNLKIVREDIIRLDAIVAGKIDFYRPVSK